MTTTTKSEYQTALAIAQKAGIFQEDLPDGMYEEIKEIIECFKESNKDEEAEDDFASAIASICEDWGFPFE